MKVIRKFFCLLFVLFPFVVSAAKTDANTELERAVSRRNKHAVQNAIDNSATNVHEMLGLALRNHAGYDVIRILTDYDTDKK